MTNKKPNILLITSDQQHWNTLGVLNDEIKTPNLDRLAAKGTLFTRAYCPNPTCTPTRASMITGMYPSQHGAWSLGTKLLEDRHTVGEDFSAAGYKTALIGKAHFQPLGQTEDYPSLEALERLHDYDFWRNFHGPFYGFDYIETCRNHADEHLAGQHYALWLEEQGCDNWRDYFRPPLGNWDPNVLHKWKLPEKYHYNTWIAERTMAKMQEYKAAEEPFFLWASFPDPHPKYLVPEPWDELYDPDELTIPKMVPGEHDKNPPHYRMTQEENPDFSAYKESNQTIHGYSSHVTMYAPEDRKKLVATYYGMVSFMDQCIGKILNQLDRLGLAEETLIVFTSDHGNLFGQHGLQAKGGFMYEDLLRVPFIVSYPGQIPQGRQSDAIQSLVDLAPTILSFAGLPIPRCMTGLDQHSVWIGKREEVRDHAICEFRHEPTTIHQKTYVDHRYKMTVYYGQTYGELFDLKEDPGEINNLWDDPQYAQLKSDLFLKYIWAELGKEPLPMPRISNA